MAYSQIQYFGFNEKVGLVSFEDTGGRRPYSKKLQVTFKIVENSVFANFEGPKFQFC